MNEVYKINSQLGDFIRYYSSLPNATIIKHNQAPTNFTIDVNQSDDKTNEYHIIVTDGLVNEFDTVKNSYDIDNNFSIIITKRLKICKSRVYAIHIEYTKTGDEINYCKLHVYMENTDDLDKIYSMIPNDIYFW